MSLETVLERLVNSESSIPQVNALSEIADSSLITSQDIADVSALTMTKERFNALIRSLSKLRSLKMITVVKTSTKILYRARPKKSHVFTDLSNLKKELSQEV